jgi:hypothetical protein
MTGPEHYERAEALAETARATNDLELANYYAAEAQVHATLALVAASAVIGDAQAWARVVS